MSFNVGDFRLWAFPNDSSTMSKEFIYKDPKGVRVEIEMLSEYRRVYCYTTEKETHSCEVCLDKLKTIIGMLHKFSVLFTKLEGNTMYVLVDLEFTVTDFDDGLNIITTLLESNGLDVNYN